MSKDNTLEHLVEHHHRNSAIKVVKLSCNFGKKVALSVGIDYASGAAIIQIAAICNLEQRFAHCLQQRNAIASR
ncbi:glycosyltransferase [Limnofasciculus baicalensis]|uniref:glycosyltransferase n=1 Tax=Limnofasciculus baicalensis TaxID=3064906 RepID=UPI0028164530|nr:glycosyltransferase [Limnofasciculus baicalensis]